MAPATRGGSRSSHSGPLCRQLRAHPDRLAHRPPPDVRARSGRISGRHFAAALPPARHGARACGDRRHWNLMRRLPRYPARRRVRWQVLQLRTLSAWRRRSAAVTDSAGQIPRMRRGKLRPAALAEPAGAQTVQLAGGAAVRDRARVRARLAARTGEAAHPHPAATHPRHRTVRLKCGAAAHSVWCSNGCSSPDAKLCVLAHFGALLNSKLISECASLHPCAGLGAEGGTMRRLTQKRSAQSAGSRSEMRTRSRVLVPVRSRPLRSAIGRRHCPQYCPHFERASG